jgi:hypothetical protein
MLDAYVDRCVAVLHQCRQNTQVTFEDAFGQVGNIIVTIC